MRKAIPFPPPPPDPEAEALLVAYALEPISGEAARMAAETLDDDAVQGELAPVWRACRRALLDGRDPDLATVAVDAGLPWTVAKVGALMHAAAPTTSDATRAVRSLVELARRRRLHVALTEAAARAQTDGAEAALDELEATTRELRRPTGEGPQILSDLATPIFVHLRERLASGEPPRAEGLPTGIAPLDRMTGGLEPGDLWVLAGRTSQGKTSLALQIALAQTVPVLFVSAEVTGLRLARKALASRAGLSVPKIRLGLVDDGDVTRLQGALDELGRAQVLVDDRSRTPAAILATIRACARSVARVRLVVVDYLQLLEPDLSGKNRQNRQEVVASVSRALKALALGEGIAVLALAQLSRAAEEDREPELRHLRESGAIEQDADVVVMIHKPPGTGDERWQSDANALRPLNLNIAKQRDGETAFVACAWDPKTQTIEAHEQITARARERQAGRGPRADSEGRHVVPMGARP